MINKLSNNFVFIQLCLLILALVVKDYSELIVLETIVVSLLTLNKLGNGIILRELITCYSAFVLLLAPLLGYTFYTIDNPLSKTWVKYMPIDHYSYYQFVFPAVIVFNLILCWPISSMQKKDEGPAFFSRINQAIKILNTSKINPKFFIVFGSLMYFSQSYLPTNLQYIGFLFFTSSFVGFLMLYLNTLEEKRTIFIIGFILFLIYLSILDTMFTVIVYMGMTISSFIFINITSSVWRKIILVFSVGLFLFALQNFKGYLRNDSSSSNVGAVSNSDFRLRQLLGKDPINGVDFFTTDRFFVSYVRANQGFLVAKVMKHTPKVKEFDNGAYLVRAIFSSLIPRFLWPDKPKAGGKFTTEYFTGEKLEGDTSMNISPVGEAYGSFGPVFGIFYMAFLALFIRGVYIWFIYLTNSIPFLIFWLPVIFFQVTYSMETDSLQIFNSLFKSSVFVFVLYIIFPSLFGVERK